MTMTDAAPSRRIDWIDIARGVALIAMAIYHFSWDLEFFGYLDPGTAGSGPLKWFARSIASSFLILVDIMSRVAIAPSELPIGVVTAFIGAPFFIYLLRTKQVAV